LAINIGGVNRKDIKVVIDFEKYSIKCHFVSWPQKQPTLRTFNQNENKLGLVLNLEHETKQTKTRTQHIRNKNQTIFYCKIYKNKKIKKKDMIRNIFKISVE
jgi:hypothetical protein